MDEKKLEASIIHEREETTLKELRGIYENEAGELPDLSTLEAPTRSWRKSGLKVAGLFLLLTTAISAGFFFSGGFSFSRGSDYLKIDLIARPIEIEAERAEPLVSGSPSRIAIRYHNLTKTPIASLSIRLNIGETFIVDRFVPEPTGPNNEWDIGSLGALSDGVIEVYGTPIGTVPSKQKIQIVTSYRPANFSSEFDDITIKEISIDTTALQLTVSSVDKASPGEQVSLLYELQNPTGSAVSGVELTAVVPEGFQVLKSEPPILENLFWKIPRMEAHSKTSFKLTGTMSADTKGLYDVGGEIYLTHEDKRYLQSQILRPIEVFGGALRTNIIVNGSAKDQNADLGSLLRISLPIENASEIDLTDVELELAIEGIGTLPIDWEGSGLNLGGGSKSGTSLFWDKEDTEAFKRFKAGDDVTIDLTLPLLETIPEGAADTFTLTATMAASRSTNTTTRLSLSTTPLTIRLNSNVSLFGSVLYYDQNGTPTGAGPLPPKVGATTTYSVIWSVQHDLHPLQNLILEAELPAHVQFKDGIETSAGVLAYRVDRRVVRWEVPRSESGVSAKFQVSVTPGSGDIGSFLKLTNVLTLSAKDAVTEGLIKKEGPTLTTVLRDDAVATDDGIVVE